MTLSLIRQSLAGQTVTVGGITPTAYYGSTTPPSIETSHLPARLLLNGDEQGRGNDGGFVAAGKLTQVSYQISDMMLWAAVTNTIGLPGWEATAASYTDEYLSMLRNWRNAGQTQAWVESFRSFSGPLEYPRGSGRWFYGVVFIVQVAELYGGA